MIEAAECPACGRVDVPPQPRCPACAAETEPLSVEPSGTVLARTRLEASWVGLVELAGEARVLAQTSRELAVGDRVRVERDEGGFVVVDPLD